MRCRAGSPAAPRSALPPPACETRHRRGAATGRAAQTAPDNAPGRAGPCQPAAHPVTEQGDAPANGSPGPATRLPGGAAAGARVTDGRGAPGAARGRDPIDHAEASRPARGHGSTRQHQPHGRARAEGSHQPCGSAIARVDAELYFRQPDPHVAAIHRDPVSAAQGQLQSPAETIAV